MVSSVDAVILRTYARCDRERDLAPLQLIPAVSSVRPTVRQHLVEPCFEQRRAGELVDRELEDQTAVFLNEPMLALHINPTIGIARGKRVDRTEVRLFAQLCQPPPVDDGLFEIRMRGDNQCLHKENLHFYRCMIAYGGAGHKNVLFRGVLTQGEVKQSLLHFEQVAVCPCAGQVEQQCVIGNFIDE